MRLILGLYKYRLDRKQEILYPYNLYATGSYSLKQ